MNIIKNKSYVSQNKRGEDSESIHHKEMTEVWGDRYANDTTY